MAFGPNARRLRFARLATVPDTHIWGPHSVPTSLVVQDEQVHKLQSVVAQSKHKFSIPLPTHSKLVPKVGKCGISLHREFGTLFLCLEKILQGHMFSWFSTEKWFISNTSTTAKKHFPSPNTPPPPPPLIFGKICYLATLDPLKKNRQDTTRFGTLGLCMRVLHILGKVAYCGRLCYKWTLSMWMPFEHNSLGELAWDVEPASHLPLLAPTRGLATLVPLNQSPLKTNISPS